MRVLTLALLLALTSIPICAQQSSVELITTLAGHTKKIETIEFSHDGQSLATSSKDKTVRLWNVATGECFATIVGDGAPPWKLRWSYDDRRLAITYECDERKWEVVVWEISGRQPPAMGQRFPATQFLEWSPDNRLFLALGQQAKLNIWDAVSGQLTQTLSAPATIRTMGFVAEGQRILTASSTEPVQLWDVASGKLAHSYTVSVPEIDWNYPILNHPWLSPDKRLLLRANVKFDPQKKRSPTHFSMLNVESGAETLTFELPKEVHMVYWAPNGTMLVINGYEFKPRLIDAATGRELGRLPFDNCWPWTMCGSDGCEPFRFNADATVLLQEKEPLKLWDTKTITLIEKLKDAHLPLVFSPTDGQVFATRSENKKSVWLWRLKRR